MKAYTVFNVEQIDGLPAHYYVRPEPVIDPAWRIAHAEDFFAATCADMRHGGNRAYYSGGSDHVQMPVFECFRRPESYYATLALEPTHCTKRLARDFGRKQWEDSHRVCATRSIRIKWLVRPRPDKPSAARR
jgi:antirestriction protein ArdC